MAHYSHNVHVTALVTTYNGHT